MTSYHHPQPAPKEQPAHKATLTSGDLVAIFAAVHPILVKETLPFPYVSYSETFLSFHQELGAQAHFCECMRPAIEAYLERERKHATEPGVRERKPWRVYRYPDVPHYFATAARLLRQPLPSFFHENAKFAPRLCHRCNKMAVYAEHFNSRGHVEATYNFGPYVAQQRFAYGVDRFGATVDTDRCPDRLSKLSPAERLQQIADEVNRDFGFPARGINNSQETLMALIIRRLFPTNTVLRRYRSPWLGRLEIDVVVEDLRLAFEFQGIQHQQPMDHLGGEAAFAKLKERDARKAELCAQNGYTLIPIYEGDEMPLESSVRRGLSLAGFGRSIPSLMEARKVPWDFRITSQSWSGRWTNNEDGMFLQAESTAGTWSVSGFDLALTITLRAERLESIDVTTAGDSHATFRMTFPATDQPVIQEHRSSSSPKDFFYSWATLDPRVTVVQSELAAEADDGSYQLYVPLNCMGQ